MDLHVSLYPYMYHGEVKLPFHPHIKNKNSKNTLDIEDEKLISKRMNIDFDSLFWIFYYIHEDNEKYILHKNDFKIKQSFIYSILENMDSYKNYFSKYTYLKKNKLTESLTNIDNNDLSFLEFVFMCSTHNIIILVKNKQFYFTNYPNYSESMILEEDNIDICVKKFVMIDENEKRIKTLNHDSFKETMHECKNLKICVSNPDKLLYSVSRYKMDELHMFASKLNIEYDVKLKKNDLYKCIKDNIDESLFFRLN